MEAFDEIMHSIGAKPVPREQIESFERAMRERVIPRIVLYEREQARRWIIG